MRLLHDFSNTKIIVVGDVMLDRYWWGDVRRISPEAPVPVIELKDRTHSAGGAANVAVNVAGLGATPMLFAVVGDDQEASILREQLVNADVDTGYLKIIPTRPTTVKTRIVAHNQHVTRVDHEVNTPLDRELENELWAKLELSIPEAKAIVISDYAKGVLTEELLTRIIQTAALSNTCVLVDPKGKNYSKYKGATIITPNKIEAAEACNMDSHDPDIVEKAGNQLLKDLQNDAVLITQGEAGMTLFQREQGSQHFPAMARKVYDVTGAGDTVIATLATALGSGFDLESATKLANTAAGIVVEQVGTTSISIKDLQHSLQKYQ